MLFDAVFNINKKMFTVSLDRFMLGTMINVIYDILHILCACIFIIYIVE